MAGSVQAPCPLPSHPLFHPLSPRLPSPVKNPFDQSCPSSVARQTVCAGVGWGFAVEPRRCRQNRCGSAPEAINKPQSTVTYPSGLSFTKTQTLT